MNTVTIELSEALWSRAVSIGVERQNKNAEAGRANASHYRNVAGKASERDCFAHVNGCLGEAAWHQYFLRLETVLKREPGTWNTGFAWDIKDHWKYANEPDLKHLGYDIEVKTVNYITPGSSVGLRRKDVDAGNLLAVAHPHATEYETPETYSRKVDLIGLYDLSLIRDIAGTWNTLTIPSYDNTNGKKCRRLEQSFLMSPAVFAANVTTNNLPVFKTHLYSDTVHGVEPNPFYI